MAYTIDSVSIKGLRKTHLKQLAYYITKQDDWYYGNRKQFEQRHKDLLRFADILYDIANDNDARVGE